MLYGPEWPPAKRSARMNPCLTLATAFAATAFSSLQASAYEIRARFSGRTGTKDPIADGMVYLPPGSLLRIRAQFGIFDNGAEPVPDGGILGWTEGTIEQYGGIATRTPGRVAPFRASQDPNANGNPPLPDGDPFTRLTDINATLPDQVHTWGFDGSGDPLPMPLPTVRGRGSFVSIFEFTLLIPEDSTENFTVSIGGNALAATSWAVIGTPTPPDPQTMTPGMVTYEPVATDPVPISAQLLVIVPGPGAATAILVPFIAALKRRR
jgi:hypothetical protein